MSYPTTGYIAQDVTLVFSFFNTATEDQIAFTVPLPILSDDITDLIESNIKSAINTTHPGYTDQSSRKYTGYAEVITHA